MSTASLTDNVLSSCSLVPAYGFFLEAFSGHRYCIYHAPVANLPLQGAILHVHPFAEEMNKSRRVSALQARAFAALGYAVLQIDLFGCGDSSGMLYEARWEHWKEDLRIARSWLDEQLHCPIHLWSIRLGSLLALDVARKQESLYASLLMWQPALDGRLYMNQFMRLRAATAAARDQNQHRQGSMIACREDLVKSEVLEIAGYELGTSLIADIDGLNGMAWVPKHLPVYWLEISSRPDMTARGIRYQQASQWQARAENLSLHPVQDAAFWSTQEIEECPSLITATQRLYACPFQ